MNKENPLARPDQLTRLLDWDETTTGAILVNTLRKSGTIIEKKSTSQSTRNKCYSVNFYLDLVFRKRIGTHTKPANTEELENMSLSEMYSQLNKIEPTFATDVLDVIGPILLEPKKLHDQRGFGLHFDLLMEKWKHHTGVSDGDLSSPEGNSPVGIPS